VKDVTLRHDLHALSLFFQYAQKMRWRDGNPVREVSIPSDADAVRMHPLSTEEEKAYFKSAFEVTDRAGRRNLYDVSKVLIDQGCRPEEIMASAKCTILIRNRARWPFAAARAARQSVRST
jgi:site-specific recombinase XerD